MQLWRSRLGRVTCSMANCLLLMKVRAVQGGSWRALREAPWEPGGYTQAEGSVTLGEIDCDFCKKWHQKGGFSLSGLIVQVWI